MPNDLSLLDPRIDFVFKRIFGSAQHPIQLLDLLNAIFAAQNMPLITSVTVQNPLLNPDWIDDKLAMLDIRATTCLGDSINIEMQMLNTRGFIKRTLYYWAELYTEPLQSGDDYTELTRTITITLMNFSRFPRDRPVSLYELREAADHHALTDLQQVIFIELTKVGLENTSEHLQQWLKFLIIEDTRIRETLAANNPAIQEALTMLKHVSQTPEERAQALRRKIALMDYKEGIAEAREEGEAVGIAKGQALGREIGWAAGKAEGQASLLLRQMTKRFGAIPTSAQQHIASADAQQLEMWAEKILDAQSIDDIFNKQ